MSEILIVDDKEKLCRSLCQNFTLLGHEASYATSIGDARQVLETHAPSVVLLDLSLGDEDGMVLLEELTSNHPDLPVIMITGYGTIEVAVKATKMGAYDFVEKPLAFDKLYTIVRNALNLGALQSENARLRSRVAALCPAMISQSAPVLALLDKARRLANTDIPVLISGESGTGKELLADFIHANSPRCAQSMNKVNSSAFAENLLDNELFGHEKGAYTGADAGFAGLFEQSHGGSLFLDEIGDMAPTTQSKILRALQEKEIKRLGGIKTIAVDVRIIAASNRSLADLVKEGRFREDLFYRLNAATLELPPLRERREDVSPLLTHFLKAFSREQGKVVTGAKESVLNAFIDYDWPGNVRELKNVVYYAAALCEGDCVTLDDLPRPFNEGKPISSGTGMTLEDVEKGTVLKALATCDNNKKQAAEMLGITRKTLYNKLQKYGLQT